MSRLEMGIASFVVGFWAEWRSTTWSSSRVTVITSFFLLCSSGNASLAEELAFGVYGDFVLLVPECHCSYVLNLGAPVWCYCHLFFRYFGV